MPGGEELAVDFAGIWYGTGHYTSLGGGWVCARHHPNLDSVPRPDGLQTRDPRDRGAPDDGSRD
jgi:hypothetical protein